MKQSEHYESNIALYWARREGLLATSLSFLAFLTYLPWYEGIALLPVVILLPGCSIMAIGLLWKVYLPSASEPGANKKGILLWTGAKVGMYFWFAYNIIPMLTIGEWALSLTFLSLVIGLAFFEYFLRAGKLPFRY